MERSKGLVLPVERLTGEDRHPFFGYYDVPAYSGDDKYHLCHRVGFMDRLPEADDVAVLGAIRLEDKQFTPFAETTAWNFQQGSMLQWNPLSPDDEVIYNRRERDRFVGVITNVHTGSSRQLSRPIAAVSPDGRHALSINFSRMFTFRPGYAYAGIPDPYDMFDHPEEDGVFLVDLETGESELILSLAQIWEQISEYSGPRKLDSLQGRIKL